MHHIEARQVITMVRIPASQATIGHKKGSY